MAASRDANIHLTKKKETPYGRVTEQQTVETTGQLADSLPFLRSTTIAMEQDMQTGRLVPLEKVFKAVKLYVGLESTETSDDG